MTPAITGLAALAFSSAWVVAGAAAMAAAQKGTVVGKPASDILLTDEATKESVTLCGDLLDGKSTIVLEWWGFH